MALVNLVRKTETLQGFQINTRDDMWTALAWLADKGYPNGDVNFNVTPSGITWQLSFNNNTQGQVAKFTDWIVLQNNQRATVYNNADATALFAAA